MPRLALSGELGAVPTAAMVVLLLSVHEGREAMKFGWSLLALGTALLATDACAQGINLTGPYRCVALCRDGLVGQPAFVTQNGWNLNLLNEAGEPSRAWIDWSGHIWAEGWNQGAIFSPDGMIIQFDRGTIWQRDMATPVSVAPPVRPRK
jgi:hypothetical protein